MQIIIKVVMNKMLFFVAAACLVSLVGCGGGDDSNEMGVLSGIYTLQSFSVNYVNGNFAEGKNGLVYVNGSQRGAYSGSMTLQSNGHCHQSMIIQDKPGEVDAEWRILDGNTLESTSNGSTYPLSYSFDGTTLTTTGLPRPGVPYTEIDIWLKTSASAMRLDGEIISGQEKSEGSGIGVLVGTLLGE